MFDVDSLRSLLKANPFAGWSTYWKLLWISFFLIFSPFQHYILETSQSIVVIFEDDGQILLLTRVRENDEVIIVCVWMWTGFSFDSENFLPNQTAGAAQHLRLGFSLIFTVWIGTCWPWHAALLRLAPHFDLFWDQVKFAFWLESTLMFHISTCSSCIEWNV